jgi:L-seryl-tRNA(Ser) seleniumtransferase
MDVYRELGIEPIINAAGTLTTLGGSLMLPEVTDAMAAASRAFAKMDELHLAAGKRIAELVGVEAAHVCAGAAAGIALMAAACMTGIDQRKIGQLPNTTGIKDHFVVHAAHRQSHEVGIRLAGGHLVEIDTDIGELEDAVQNENVAAVFYTFAWFLTGEALPLGQVAEIAHRHGVPVIVDAAAEVPPVENLWRFTKEGADLVAFSGGKAIRGPQSTGLILGRADLVEACRLNDCPNPSIGRLSKVCKEEIVGLVKAVELYVQRDHNTESFVWDRRVARVMETLSNLEAVQVKRQLPYGIGQQIPHVALTWDEQIVGVTYTELVERLLDGTPRIAVQRITTSSEERGLAPGDEIRIHPHTLREGEEVVVAERIRHILVSGDVGLVR